MDARILDGGAVARSRIEIFYDGDRVYSREFPSRELAVAEAERRLRDLQRSGWTTHW